jgi:hypothetical protein
MLLLHGWLVTTFAPALFSHKALCIAIDFAHARFRGRHHGAGMPILIIKFA